MPAGALAAAHDWMLTCCNPSLIVSTSRLDCRRESLSQFSREPCRRCDIQVSNHQSVAREPAKRLLWTAKIGEVRCPHRTQPQAVEQRGELRNRRSREEHGCE